MRTKPRCVLTSDVHFSLNTLPLATAALKAALEYAEDHDVPLVIAGDLHDTKAIVRGECANAIIDILEPAHVEVIVLIGNHDLINEKGKEHSLNFLKPYATVIQEPVEYLGLWFIPYQNSAEELKKILGRIPSGSTLIMHQGVQGAFMGEYVVDKTSIEPEALADFRVISGHYHRAQDIKCGRPRKGAVGLFSYIGSPYTVTFAEAHDGPKGFRVLREDGTLELIPTGLRKHVIVERDCADVMNPIEGINSNDLLWLKVRGPASELDKLSKKAIGEAHLGHQSYKLDKLYTEAARQTIVEIEKMPDDKILDQLIDDSEETATQKRYLKKLWREVLE